MFNDNCLCFEDDIVYEYKIIYNFNLSNNICNVMYMCYVLHVYVIYNVKDGRLADEASCLHRSSSLRGNKCKVWFRQHSAL